MGIVFFIVKIWNSLWATIKCALSLRDTVVYMAKKVPEHIAFRLAQKAKDAEKKVKAAEKKAREAEKKAKEADKKIKAAEKKAKEAEEKAKEVVEELEIDDFDDFDDLDDFDDVEEESIEEESIEEESIEEKTSQDTESPDSDDSELEELMKQASSSEGSEARIQRAKQMVSEGNFEGALEIWKGLTATDADNPENWRGLASVLESRNLGGDVQKAQTARDHASRIETQAIANKTGRKMEDIVADLMDDGVLNFSAGSDAKETE